MPTLTTNELLALITDPATPNAAVAPALSSAVLYIEDIPSAVALNGEPVSLFAGDSRRVSLLPVSQATATRYPAAQRLIYVLAGQVTYTGYEAGDAITTPVDSHVMGVGQVKDIVAGVTHQLSARGQDAVVLDVLSGEPERVEALPHLSAGGEPPAYFYEYEECYRRVYEAGAELWEKAGPNEALVQIVEHYGDTLGSRWLDLGCGEGRDSLYLASRDFVVTSVDVSRIALDKARSRAAAAGLACTFLERDVTRLDGLPHEGYDVAINMGCLHMLSDQAHRRMHLERVAQVLKPNGHFIVAHCRSEWLKGFYSVPDYEQVGPAVPGRVLPRRIRLADGTETWIDLPTTHFREADQQELTEELAAANLNVVRALSQDDEAFGNTVVLLARKA